MPRIAARLLACRPWASGIVTSAIASEPTIATATGAFPSRIAGTTNTTTTTRLTRQADQRERALQPREHQHHEHEQAGQQEHRGAALEVVERVPGARDRRRGALGRRRRLGHEDVVARIEVGIEAPAAERHADAPAGVGPALEPDPGQLAVLRAEARARHLLDALAPRPSRCRWRGCRPACRPPRPARAPPSRRRWPARARTPRRGGCGSAGGCPHRSRRPGRDGAGPRRELQVAHRVHRRPVHAGLEVEVVPEAVAGAAHGADHLSLAHGGAVGGSRSSTGARNTWTATRCAGCRCSSRSRRPSP